MHGRSGSLASVAKKPSAARSRLGKAVFLAGVFVIGFALSASGARSGRPSFAQPPSAVVPPAASGQPAVAVARAPIETRAGERPLLRSPGPSPDAARAAKATHGRRLLRFLFDHARQLRAKAAPGTPPEGIANESVAFLTGWVDALRFTSADVLDAVGEDLRAHACAGDLDPDETLVSTYVLQWVPEIASGTTFDCLLADPRHRDVEDVQLWATLDAWRNSGLEAPPALAALKSTAQDPRTIRRFAPLGEDLQRRGGIAQAATSPAGGAPTIDPSAR